MVSYTLSAFNAPTNTMYRTFLLVIIFLSNGHKINELIGGNQKQKICQQKHLTALNAQIWIDTKIPILAVIELRRYLKLYFEDIKTMCIYNMRNKVYLHLDAMYKYIVYQLQSA